MVTLSVGEAEYMELASTGRQAAWLKSFSREIGFPIKGPIPLCSDNQAVIFLTINPAVEHQTKYIDIRHHYIWEQYKEKVIEPFMLLEKKTQQICSPSPCRSSKWKSLGLKSDCHRYIQFSGSVEMEYHEMLFQLETEYSDKELYWIIAQW